MEVSNENSRHGQYAPVSEGQRESLGEGVLVIDCESYDSAINSIADAFRANTADVAGFLLGMDLDEDYRTKTISKRADEYLVELFRSEFGLPSHEWKGTFWFHLTRVPPGTDFAEGILPLHLALKKIWASVMSIPKSAGRRSNLEKLRETGVPDFQYRLRTGNKMHSGPYAMLVRESAFQSVSMLNHDYLSLPEIIEDICNGYESQFGESIFEEVSKALRPCIVKFEVTDKDSSDLIQPALMYCWSKAHDQELSIYANTCYDGGGAVIPNSAIRKIEFV